MCGEVAGVEPARACRACGTARAERSEAQERRAAARRLPPQPPFDCRRPAKGRFSCAGMLLICVADPDDLTPRPAWRPVCNRCGSRMRPQSGRPPTTSGLATRLRLPRVPNASQTRTSSHHVRTKDAFTVAAPSICVCNPDVLLPRPARRLVCRLHGANMRLKSGRPRTTSGPRTYLPLHWRVHAPSPRHTRYAPKLKTELTAEEMAFLSC